MVKARPNKGRQKTEVVSKPVNKAIVFATVLFVGCLLLVVAYFTIKPTSWNLMSLIPGAKEEHTQSPLLTPDMNDKPAADEPILSVPDGESVIQGEAVVTSLPPNEESDEQEQNAPDATPVEDSISSQSPADKENLDLNVLAPLTTPTDHALATLVNDDQSALSAQVEFLSVQADTLQRDLSIMTDRTVRIEESFEELQQSMNELAKTRSEADQQTPLFTMMQLWRVEQAIHNGEPYFTTLQPLARYLPISDQDFQAALSPVPIISSLHADLLAALDDAQSYEARYDDTSSLTNRLFSMIRWRHDDTKIAGITLAEYRSASSGNQLQAIVQQLEARNLDTQHPLQLWLSKVQLRQERMSWLANLWNLVAPDLVRGIN